MIKKAVTPIEQSIFLNWITKNKENSMPKKTFNFSDSMLKNIFLNIISDKSLLDDYVTISFEIYTCIQNLFEIVNINEEILENYGKISKRVLKYDAIYGMEYFWNILIRNNNENVTKACKNFLINIHLKFGNAVSTEQKLKIWQNFINKCLDLLNSNVCIAVIISLVKGFFEK